jgi:hypothetical protein
MYVTKLLVIAVGIAAVATLAVRPSFRRGPGLRLVASLMPLSLIAGAVLAFLPSQG